eukprot:Amastigsp_a343286_26.p5 type:complete len:171 gc:universal Amastigsp_a343286_26:1919-1407(-)
MRSLALWRTSAAMSTAAIGGKPSPSSSLAWAHSLCAARRCSTRRRSIARSAFPSRGSPSGSFSLATCTPRPRLSCTSSRILSRSALSTKPTRSQCPRATTSHARSSSSTARISSTLQRTGHMPLTTSPTRRSHSGCTILACCERKRIDEFIQLMSQAGLSRSRFLLRGRP